MDTFILVARNHLERRKNSKTCPIEDTRGPEIVPFVGNLTFHQFATILSGACAILSTIIVGILIALHAFNYSNPVQQRQIIRIMLLVPWVALFSFLVVWREDAGEYLVHSLDFGCSIALSAFLLFMCDLVLSHREGFDALFGEGARAKGTLKENSPNWLKVSCYPIIKTIGSHLTFFSVFGTACFSSYRPVSSYGLPPQLPLLPAPTANSPTTYTSHTCGSRFWSHIPPQSLSSVPSGSISSTRSC